MLKTQIKKVGRCHTVNNGAVTGKDFLTLILKIGVLLCYHYSSAVHALVTEGEVGSVDRVQTSIEIALELHQIVKINQREENFTAVVTLHLRYTDPTLVCTPSAPVGQFSLIA